MRIDAAPEEPLHRLLVQAGAEYRHHEADQGLVFMANIFKPRRFLKLIGRDLGQRAKAAGLPRPCQLGLLINNEKYRLSVSRRNVELIPGALGRSYLKCSLYDVNQLLLGHLDVRDAIAQGGWSFPPAWLSKWPMRSSPASPSGAHPGMISRRFSPILYSLDTRQRR